MPVAPVRLRQVHTGSWADQLLGLQLHRLLRARRALLLDRPDWGSRSPSSRRWSRRSTARASRSSSTSSTTTPARATSSGRRSAFRGIDNAAYYRLVHRPAALLHGLHRLRQHPQHGAPAHAPAHHGLSALLGAGDARRRLPLRPRLGARARAARRRPPRRLLRHHPPRPRALAGQAHRRALGLGRGRLSGRQLPRAVGRVERRLPRQRASFLARRPRPARRPRLPPDGQSATSTSGAAVAPTPASTSSPRTTASPCATSSATTRSTTRPTGRATATATTTTSAGTAASRAEPDDPEVVAMRARQQRNFLATLLLSQGVPMLVAGDEIGAHAARQQQRLVSGQRDFVGQLGAGRARARPSWSSRASSSKSFTSTRCFAAESSSKGAPSAALRSRTSPGSAPTVRR